MKAHIDVLGWINIASGTLGLLAAGVVFTLLFSLAPLADEAPGWVMRLAGLFAAGALSLAFVPALIAGVGLLQRRPWSRILAIILAALSLFNVPVGTILAIYAFWVLTNDEATRLLSVAS